VADHFFLREPERKPRPPRAIFASQPKRGLAFVTEVWAEIWARAPGAELHVFCPQAKEREAAEACGGKPGVVIRGSVSRAKLGEELRAARLMLIPGVADETFCLAAAEAAAAGVPIVTRGAGALAERVEQGETGFISPEPDDFIRDAVRLLTEDELWLKMHATCVADPALATWNERAAEWEALFEEVGVC
jgi:glycosyltransferase involved in cell wall biosynthesis